MNKSDYDERIRKRDELAALANIKRLRKETSKPKSPDESPKTKKKLPAMKLDKSLKQSRGSRIMK